MTNGAEIEIQVVKVRYEIPCEGRNFKPRKVVRFALKRNKHMLVIEDYSIFEGLNLQAGMTLQVKVK